MNRYILDYSAQARADMEYHLKSGNKSRLRKIARLLSEIEEHPKKGTGKPEQLKHELSGKWSRRINDEDRIVYEIDEEGRRVKIHQMKDHYQ